MSSKRLALVCLGFLCQTLWAGSFGEGYSSATPNAPARIHYRAFTIYTAEEACAKSPTPARLTILPARLSLRIGDRLYRHEGNELIIEAYDETGRFLSAVPILVDVFAEEGVVTGRSDWDYLEATAEGEGELRVRWGCPSDTPIEQRARISIKTKSSS